MDYCLSVVVTIYNVGQYLDHCITSIINQKYKHLDIVLINDGSTDNSLSICQKYAEKDVRVKIITKKNEGIILARKAGIDNAVGEYITFVDGDDYIAEDYYYNIMKRVNGESPDLFANGCTQDGDKGMIPLQQAVESGKYSSVDELQYLYRNINFLDFNCYTFGIYPSVCLKVFKTASLREQCAKIPPDVTFGEDACFSFPYILRANSIIIDNSIKGYYYRVVHDSMSRPKEFSKLFNTNKVYEYLKGYYYNTHDERIIDQIELYRTYLAEQSLHSIMADARLSDVKTRVEIIKEYTNKNVLFSNSDLTFKFGISKKYRNELKMISTKNWRLFELTWKKRLVLFYLRTMARKALKKLLRVCFTKHIQI